jgi:hypothetical protein
MSDYLTNLVARSLAPSAGVLPRLPTAFEPSPETALPGEDEPPPLEVVEIKEASHRSAAPDRAPEATTMTPRAFPPSAGADDPNPPASGTPVARSAAAPLRPSDEETPPPAAASELQRGPVAPSITAARAIEPRSAPVDSPALAPAVKPARALSQDEVLQESPAPAPSVAAPSPMRQPVAPRLEPSMQQAPTVPPEVPAAAPPPVTPTHARPAAEQPEVVVPLRMSEARPAPVKPVVARHEPALESAEEPPQVARAAPAVPEALKAGPTIQVTIGRVEVRAKLPPATPPDRPRRQPAVMSLEEYLRRRGGDV